MRFASQRFERFFQRIEGGAGPGQHLLAFVQQMQFIQAQGADNHDLAIVIIAVGGRTFGQAGVGRLHQNNFIGVYAGVKHAPEFQQGAGKDNRQRLALTGAEAFATHLVVHEWTDAQPRLRIIFRDNAFPERSVDLGDQPHDVDLSANPEWEADTIRFVTHSMVSPPTLYEEHVATAERVLLRQAPTPNVDLTEYVTRRLWAPSAATGEGTSDGDPVLVPLDIVHHVDTPLDGTAAAVLYGYGSYEASLAPWFSVARLSLLDRGMVFALAHPRGGGELGRTWYLDGKLLAKQHTFDDMVACSEHLVSEQICADDRLAIRGGSAGGLLVGACMTQRPELYSSVVAEVPFVDIVSTMSDPTLPLTVTEWEEWGDPRAEPYASVMAAYSPYDNTVAAAYPAVYVSAGLNDPRVSVHEPAKWVARIRDVNTSDAPIIMRTEMGAGHGGPTGRYDAWRDEARTLAFLLATT